MYMDVLELRLSTPLLLAVFITWQGSLEANPSIQIGSFLYRTLLYGPFPRKWLYAINIFGLYYIS